jgi:Tol biopolymer transport system component
MVLTVGAGRETWTNKRIALVDLKANSWEYLTGETVSAFSPSFSSDGRQIAYVAAPDAGHISGGDAAEAAAAQRRIWVMDADGSNQRALTGDPTYRDERPLWSLDGSYLLFTRLDENECASLWLMSTVDGVPRQLIEELTPAPASFGYYNYVDWSELLHWWRGNIEALSE